MSLRWLPILLLLTSGCGFDPAELDLPQSNEKPTTPIGQSFVSALTGRIVGHVTWSDRIPNVPPIEYRIPKSDGSGFEMHITENPNRPRINPTTRAIGDAVVYLKNIDPARSHPWDLPPVGVAIGDGQIVVTQGSYRGRNGFVRRGDTIDMVSTEETFHIVRGRVDGFFSITFPTPFSPVSRPLNREGRIELSSGTGLSFMRADLFVSDHPYYTRTEPNGQFKFELVPPGQYELVIWLPNWEVGKPFHEPESALVVRQTYAPAFVKVIPITVENGQNTLASASLP